ncbi:MAG: DUF1579 family protein [Alphaproteobacteria bacterium]
MARVAMMTAAAVIAGLSAVVPAAAQQPTEEEMMAAWQAAMAVGPQHEALAARVGTWAVTTTYAAMPGSDQMITEHGTAERTVALDGRVVEERFAGSMMGMPFTGEGRTGYDNVTGRYWTTWTDTMSTALIVLYGSYDEATATYTFEGTTVAPLMGDIPTRIERVIDGPDRETSVFYFQYPGMDEAEVMEIAYERQ